MLLIVLLLPDDDQGWNLNLMQINGDDKKIFLLQYYQYLLNKRCNQTNSTIKGQKMLQQCVVMAWTRTELQKLQFYQLNQTKMRFETDVTFQIIKDERDHDKSVVLTHKHTGLRQWYTRKSMKP